MSWFVFHCMVNHCCYTIIITCTLICITSDICNMAVSLFQFIMKWSCIHVDARSIYIMENEASRNVSGTTNAWKHLTGSFVNGLKNKSEVNNWTKHAWESLFSAHIKYLEATGKSYYHTRIFVIQYFHMLYARYNRSFWNVLTAFFKWWVGVSEDIMFYSDMSNDNRNDGKLGYFCY